MLHLEVCVDTVEGAIAAEQGGATRLELCSNLIIGGTTPSISLLKIVKENVKIPVHAIIRPRFGDFCYSDLEFEEIKDQVVAMKEAGADGVVIGIVKPEGLLDKVRMAELIELAKPMHVALHRAFDVCKDPFETLETAIDLGIQTILTSGQKQTALGGADLLGALIEKANDKIDIMPGGGINSDTILEIMEKTGAKSYHMSGRAEIESPMIYRNPNVSMGLDILSEYSLFKTDSHEINKVKSIIEKNK
ncbi:MAG: copper homeostasis protein CutC [Epulopiscium sp.]|nr:copper homeostasis protein CutC [Candidatus Epulonipiscium sp.]